MTDETKEVEMSSEYLESSSKDVMSNGRSSTLNAHQICIDY